MKTDFAVHKFDEMSQVLKVLADSSRIAILRILIRGEQSVTAIHQAAGLAQPTVSRHLMQMRMMRLVTARRDGKQVKYSLGPSCSATSNGLSLELPDGLRLALKLTDRPEPKVAAA